jgi:hypothetical protein
MTPFYQSMELNTRERVSLAAGSYGSSSQPGLKIVNYNGAKDDKSGAQRHSFLVVATRPSREQIQAHAAGNGKAQAAGDPFSSGDPDYEGSAFLSLTVHSDWTHPAALAMAFTEASRNKAGNIQHDYLAAAVASGEVEAQVAKDGEVYYRKLALDKVLAANTPGNQIDAAIEAQYRKELLQISIKIGHIFNLEDWAGIPRDPSYDLSQLVGVEFAGKIESREFNGKVNSEVTGIYSKSEKKAA